MFKVRRVELKQLVTSKAKFPIEGNKESIDNSIRNWDRNITCDTFGINGDFINNKRVMFDLITQLIKSKYR